MLRTKLISCAVAIAAAVSAVAPAGALPLTVPTAAVEPAGDVTNVQYNRRGYYIDNGYGHYNGHRGYRYARPGWRQHNGWWFPPAAFALGLIVGQGVQPGYRELPNRHYRWCANTYNSYRRSDNSYNAGYGNRRTCRSPYWG